MACFQDQKWLPTGLLELFKNKILGNKIKVQQNFKKITFALE